MIQKMKSSFTSTGVKQQSLSLPPMDPSFSSLKSLKRDKPPKTRKWKLIRIIIWLWSLKEFPIGLPTLPSWLKLNLFTLLIDPSKASKLLTKSVDPWRLTIEWLAIQTKDIAKFGSMRISLPIIQANPEEFFNLLSKNQKISSKENSKPGLHPAMKQIWSKMLSMPLKSIAKREDSRDNLVKKFANPTWVFLKPEASSDRLAWDQQDTLFQTALIFSTIGLEDIKPSLKKSILLILTLLLLSPKPLFPSPLPQDTDSTTSPLNDPINPEFLPPESARM